MNYVMNESTGEIKFYVGSPTVPDATTNLVMTLQNNLITFHKPTSPNIGGGGGVDDTNLYSKIYRWDITDNRRRFSHRWRGSIWKLWFNG